MGKVFKEFMEYSSDNIRKNDLELLKYPLCSCLNDYAIDYIKENRSAIANIDKKVRDAVLVDSINYLGVRSGIDYGMDTEYLYDTKIRIEKLGTQYVLTTMQNFYAIYIFKNVMVESILGDNTNNCADKFDASDGATVLVDFINYIAQVNDYDRKFTIKDLYEKFKNQEHKDELNRLKEFIEKSSKYRERLVNGESIDSIFKAMVIKYDLSDFTADGKYYIDGKLEEIHPAIKNWIEEEIYEMAYAYGKMPSAIKEQPQTEIINKKLLEMKTR